MKPCDSRDGMKYPGGGWRDVFVTIEELASLEEKYEGKVCVVLVCIKAEEICVLQLADLNKRIGRRTKENGGQEEEQYTLLATVPKGKSFRVYMNSPGEKKKSLKQQIVPRNAFPGHIFQ